MKNIIQVKNNFKTELLNQNRQKIKKQINNQHLIIYLNQSQKKVVINKILVLKLILTI